MRRILVVDDNENILTFVQPALERAGFAVQTARDGDEALYLAETVHPDLIILDIEMPTVSGLDVCRILRERGDTTPIIFLTVRDSVADLEIGFALGASDYVRKPFDVRELVSRVKARLPAAGVEFEDFRIDTLARRVEVRHGGQWEEVHLKPKEFDLLRVLVDNAGRAIGRTTLLEQVFGLTDDMDIETKTLEKHIWAVRQKLEPDPREPRYIVNVRGVGYRFEGRRR